MDFLFTPLGMIFTIVGFIMLLFAITDPLKGMVLMMVYGIAATLASPNMAVSGFGVGVILAGLTPRAVAESKSFIHRDRMRAPIDWMMVALIAIAVIHMIVGIAKGNKFRYLGGDFYHMIFEITLPYFLFRIFLRDPDRMKRFLEMTAIAMGILAGVLLILLATGWIRMIPGAGWDMAHTNFFRFRYSHHFPLNPLLLLLGITAVGKWGKREHLFPIATALLFAVLAVSLKRANWLAFIAMVLPMPLFLPARSKMRFFAVGTVFAAVMVSVMIFSPDSFKPVTDSVILDRAQSLQTGAEAFGNRFEQAELAFQLALKNPFGYGLGSELQTLHATPVHYVHNTLLHYALQAGIPAALLILALYVKSIIHGLKLALRLPEGPMRGAVLGSAMGLAAAMITGLTEATVNTYFFALFIAIIYGVDMFVRLDEREKDRRRTFESARAG